MKTLIVHLPGGDKTFTSDEFTFGFVDKTGSVEIMKTDGTGYTAFFNVAAEVQTSDPELTPEIQADATNDQTPVEQAPEATVPPDPAPPTV